MRLWVDILLLVQKLLPFVGNVGIGVFSPKCGEKTNIPELLRTEYTFFGDAVVAVQWCHWQCDPTDVNSRSFVGVVSLQCLNCTRCAPNTDA